MPFQPCKNGHNLTLVGWNASNPQKTAILCPLFQPFQPISLYKIASLVVATLLRGEKFGRFRWNGWNTPQKWLISAGYSRSIDGTLFQREGGTA